MKNAPDRNFRMSFHVIFIVKNVAKWPNSLLKNSQKV
jgi:hypothetical protein